MEKHTDAKPGVATTEPPRDLNDSEKVAKQARFDHEVNTNHPGEYPHVVTQVVTPMVGKKGTHVENTAAGTSSPAPAPSGSDAVPRTDKSNPNHPYKTPVNPKDRQPQPVDKPEPASVSAGTERTGFKGIGGAEHDILT
jgi:hypothetical protein